MMPYLILAVIGFYFGLIRNSIVYSIRRWFIDNDMDSYCRLPSYESMVLNPRYCLLWRVGQWRDWLSSRSL